MKRRGDFKPYGYTIVGARDGGWDYVIEGESRLSGWRRGPRAQVERYLADVVRDINVRHKLTPGRNWMRSAPERRVNQVG
jgi:hypothetical protein